MTLDLIPFLQKEYPILTEHLPALRARLEALDPQDGDCVKLKARMLGLLSPPSAAGWQEAKALLETDYRVLDHIHRLRARAVPRSNLDQILISIRRSHLANEPVDGLLIRSLSTLEGEPLDPGRLRLVGGPVVQLLEELESWMDTSVGEFEEFMKPWTAKHEKMRFLNRHHATSSAKDKAPPYVSWDFHSHHRHRPRSPMIDGPEGGPGLFFGHGLSIFSCPMVYVEGGSFIAGLESDNSDLEDEDSSDMHPVSLSSFFLGKFVVTQGLYRVVMGKRYYNLENEGPDQFPLYRVEWHDAIEFCNRLSDLSGLERVYSVSDTSIHADMTRNGYRLPTGAEWEFAARGGNLAEGFSLGGSPHLGTIAWYADNPDSHRHPVGRKAANELGLHDMLGNQTCWCWDYEDSGSSQIDLDDDDEDAPSCSGGIGSPERGKGHTTRGGSYNDDALICLKLSKASIYVSKLSLPGFRLARSAGLRTSSKKD